MSHDLILKTESKSSGVMLKIKRIFQKQKTGEITRFGKTLGIVWEYKSFYSGEAIACIVEIKRSIDSAEVTIYDSHDPKGTSATNCLEYIASGVYLEHLSTDYRPSQIKFIHRTPLPFGSSEQQWGNMPVNLTWNKKQKHFEKPEWAQWRPDFEIPEPEKEFVQELRFKAAVEIERFMRERNERSQLTPRERELYDRYKEHISAKSELYRYNLRGGWIFSQP